ncbi:GNAT family N-acetyltransferase [uncultured Flavobacterium sp.]|uniref:GNAT family N-acetyltransferase n=1 Tax=uncultured Flavobacterium sp. TaxID=165435 RepID=UPI0025EF8294|nr:GNAT family N-acetyltransferase [uncultured Flavobacterium sp.]
MPQFKPFETTDAHALIAMMEAFYAIDNYPIDTAVSRGLFLEFLENDGLGRGWMIFHDGKPVGYVILTFVFSFEYKGRIAFLDELFISPDARGLGLGKQTLDFIDGQAKLLSVKIIYLEIEGHNTVAQKLYLSKGYAVHNRGLMKRVVL